MIVHKDIRRPVCENRARKKKLVRKGQVWRDRRRGGGKRVGIVTEAEVDKKGEYRWAEILWHGGKVTWVRWDRLHRDYELAGGA